MQSDFERDLLSKSVRPPSLPWCPCWWCWPPPSRTGSGQRGTPTRECPARPLPTPPPAGCCWPRSLIDKKWFDLTTKTLWLIVKSVTLPAYPKITNLVKRDQVINLYKVLLKFSRDLMRPQKVLNDPFPYPCQCVWRWCREPWQAVRCSSSGPPGTWWLSERMWGITTGGGRLR